MTRVRFSVLALIGLGTLAAACGGKKPPVVNPPPAPPASSSPAAATPMTPPGPPTPAAEPPSVPMEPMTTSDLNAQPLEDINKAQPLKPAFFALDSDTLDDVAQQALTADAQVLKQYANWAVTIEGHCDERGSAEYNLALGERRALAAKNYLVSLGISADRMKTVSYGKEFPFDPGHDESAWSKNRRAHFVVTGK